MDFSVSCLATCTARACAPVLFLIDEIILCGRDVLWEDRPEDDIFVECSEEIAACIGATC